MIKSRKFAAFAFIVFFLLSCLGSYAQKDVDEFGFIEGRVFYVGAVAGANFTQVDGDHYAGFTKAGLNVGGIGYARINKRMALSYELLYSQKGSRGQGARIGGQDSIILSKYGINVNYAEIPVMLNYFDKKMSHVGIGISYNQLLNSSEYASYYPAYPIDLSKYPFKKTDIEFLAGAQLRLWKGFFFNLRYQYSILPMRSSIPPYIARSKQYNNMWTVRLMYLLM